MLESILQSVEDKSLEQLWQKQVKHQNAGKAIAQGLELEWQRTREEQVALSQQKEELEGKFLQLQMAEKE